MSWPSDMAWTADGLVPLSSLKLVEPVSMTDQNEKADLEQLLLSNGWLRYENALKAYWNDQYDAQVEAAADQTSDETAMQLLRQVIAGKKAVKQALAWPRERLRLLTRPEATTTLSRGGYGA